MIHNVQQAQFIEKVLGIELNSDQLCLMLEGKIHQSTKESILLETAIYEGFLDDLASKIGGVPKAIAKTLTDATSVLTFIYNVISDKTGANLSKAIAVITRNCKAMFAKIERIANALPGSVKDLFTKVIEWIKDKTKGILAVQSDTDPADKLSGDSSNWKKFILLLLVGMLLTFLKYLPDKLKDFGNDAVSDGLSQIWKATQDLAGKFLSAPADMIKFVAGGSLVKMLLPLIGLYKGAKMLQSINGDLLDANAWLKKEMKLFNEKGYVRKIIKEVLSHGKSKG
jgi:hypothetical protein